MIYNNRAITENGAIGYRTSTKALLDLNFKLSSLRAMREEYIVSEFIKAYYESPMYAVKWLFFARDILEGMGERRTFRVGLRYLAISQPEVAGAVIKYIPEYGRFDDALVLLDTPLAGEAAELYRKQFDDDLVAMAEGREISLLAKWLPSVNTSSETTRKYAYQLCRHFKMSPKQYRQTLAKLRRYGNVVESRMSASDWSAIDYNTVPAKANMKYDAAFEKHDFERRTQYFENLIEGEGKLNAKGLMPYEIVHKMTKDTCFCMGVKGDLLSELMWKKMMAAGFRNDWGIEDAIVVADGSGSMYQLASGSSSVSAIEICNSLAIYFAEQLRGYFHNKAITFSGHPEFVDLQEGTGLKEKLEIMFSHNEVANTNIEAVFDLILDMATDKAIPQEELPKQVLIISDMEFDEATDSYFYDKRTCKNADDTLFSQIAKKYKAAGYRMPRLIFWNVCGRSNTIPMVKNGEGLCLLSGFSQNAIKVAANRDVKDPYEALLATLDSPRYRKIEEALLESGGIAS